MAGRLRKAERRRVLLRVLLSGPSNAGKTYSALRLATGMADSGEIALVDSENCRSLYYADKFQFFHLDLKPPFSPQAYIDAIRECEEAGSKVIVLDSISHEWDGPGGCLDMVDKIGGKFQAWKKVTPQHQKFVHAMLYSSAHIIATTRRKQEYAVEEGGKKVRKLGLKEVQRDGLEYEFTFSFDIQHPSHYASISKDSDYFGEDYSPKVIDEDLGRELLAWAGVGVEPPPDPDPETQLAVGQPVDPESPAGLRLAILEAMERHAITGPRRDSLTKDVTDGKYRRCRDILQSDSAALMKRYLERLEQHLEANQE